MQNSCSATSRTPCLPFFRSSRTRRSVLSLSTSTTIHPRARHFESSGVPTNCTCPACCATSTMLSAPTGSCTAKTSEHCWLLKNSTVHLRWRTASVQSTRWLPNGVWHPPGHPTCWCATGTSMAAIATISASTRYLRSDLVSPDQEDYVHVQLFSAARSGKGQNPWLRGTNQFLTQGEHRAELLAAR